MLKYLCIISIVVAASCTYAQKSLSLEEALSIALQRNTTLEKSENTIKTYESGLLASYGNLLPDVNAFGNFDWSRTKDNQGGTAFIGGIPYAYEGRSIENRNYSVGIQSNWVLFDGLANYATLQRSRTELESYRLSVERLKQDITFTTIDLYYMVLNTQQLVKFREEDVAWNQKNFETVSERNKLGAITLADVYAQQVRLGNAELELIRSRNNLETAKSNLLYYLGLDVLTEYTFSEAYQEDLKNITVSAKFGEIRELVNRAFETRFDYRSALLNIESAESGITSARSGHFPRLNGNAGYTLRANRIQDLNNSRTVYAGLTLSIPIFSGFNVSNQVQIAQVNAENRRVEMVELSRSITQNIQKTYLDLQAAEKAIEVSRRNVEAAEENRRIEQEKYSLGSGTILNVLIANSEYQNAQTNFINSQFDFLTLSEQLQYLIGTLDYKKYE
jgi:outer membrane protein